VRGLYELDTPRITLIGVPTHLRPSPARTSHPTNILGDPQRIHSTHHPKGFFQSSSRTRSPLTHSLTHSDAPHYCSVAEWFINSTGALSCKASWHPTQRSSHWGGGITAVPVVKRSDKALWGGRDGGCE